MTFKHPAVTMAMGYESKYYVTTDVYGINFLPHTLVCSIHSGGRFHLKAEG